MIVIFSSYGSPSKTPLTTPTPIRLSSSQRLSIRPLYSNNQNVSLYFTRAESDDVVSGLQFMNNDAALFNSLRH